MVQLEALVEDLHPNEAKLPQGWKERATRIVDQLQTSNCGSYGPPLTGAACAMPWHAVSRSCSGQIDFGFIL